jgi:hypothetical protein
MSATKKKAAAKQKKQAKPAAKKPAPKPVQKAKPQPAPPAKPAVRPGSPAPAAPQKAGAPKAGGKPGSGKPAKKSGRKSGLLQRRGPNGELLSPGDILIPGGVQGSDETQYLVRGAVAAEHSAGDAGVSEVLSRRPLAEDGEKAELGKILHHLIHRFDGGAIEPLLPPRPQSPRRTFQTVVERAKHRRREIGAFLRGLDIGRTETSHMDSHGEASLQSLMEWAARLENLAEADEPEQADYAMFHRGLDQLDGTTEALIVDVELTLRRLRDRNRAKN